MGRMTTLLLPLALWAGAAGLSLSPDQTAMIGRRIWQNEGGGKVAFLTHWNVGEGFASMGIGHFIWYPAGRRDRFVESFPGLAAYLAQKGKPLAPWTDGPCPWATLEQFKAAYDTPPLVQLRARLSEPEVIALQTEFIIERLRQALPALLQAAPVAERAELERRFDAVLGHPVGAYALIDYVNFKGEGVSPTERYNGEGWGLLQSLQLMDTTAGKPPHEAFADGAAQALRRRVANAPQARREQEGKWLPGWLKRLDTYRVSRLEDLAAAK